jgi:hypothetical protein
MTFDELIAIEPELEEAKNAARLFPIESAEYYPERVWSYKFKPWINSLVGWERHEPHDILSTSEAYEVAYRAIRDAFETWR